VGTGAISYMHARAYKNIGSQVTVCTDVNEEAGRRFAEKHGAEFVLDFQDVCRHPSVDLVDVCTFPDFRLAPLEVCAEMKKPIQVQKPMATNLETAGQMIETARQAGIQLGVVSQHRFDDASLFLSKAIAEGRLGRILQADAYVKWYRSPEYYSRPIKGSWAVEGGGALINQAIHQVDILLWLAGPVREVFGFWQLGARHNIESEDVISVLLRYKGGATGVIQSSTAMWPGYTERVEIHGTKGTAVIAGDKLTIWDVDNDS
jgi:predicted dehydrogenase